MATITQDLGDIRGPQGPKGDPGKNGNAYTALTVDENGDLYQHFEDAESAPTLELDEDYNLMYVLSDAASVNLGNVKGPKGDKGEKGETGASFPSGGTPGQVLELDSAGNPAWGTPESGGSTVYWVQAYEVGEVNNGTVSVHMCYNVPEDCSVFINTVYASGKTSPMFGVHPLIVKIQKGIGRIHEYSLPVVSGETLTGIWCEVKGNTPQGSLEASSCVTVFTIPRVGGESSGYNPFADVKFWGNFDFTKISEFEKRPGWFINLAKYTGTVPDFVSTMKEGDLVILSSNDTDLGVEAMVWYAGEVGGSKQFRLLSWHETNTGGTPGGDGGDTPGGGGVTPGGGGDTPGGGGVTPGGDGGDTRNDFVFTSEDTAEIKYDLYDTAKAVWNQTEYKMEVKLPVGAGIKFSDLSIGDVVKVGVDRSTFSSDPYSMGNLTTVTDSSGNTVNAYLDNNFIIDEKHDYIIMCWDGAAFFGIMKEIHVNSEKYKMSWNEEETCYKADLSVNVPERLCKENLWGWHLLLPISLVENDGTARILLRSTQGSESWETLYINVWDESGMNGVDRELVVNSSIREYLRNSFGENPLLVISPRFYLDEDNQEKIRFYANNVVV